MLAILRIKKAPFSRCSPGLFIIAAVAALPAFHAPAQSPPVAAVYDRRLPPAAGKASHVVLMVWDGMRPDFVTPENTPVLYRLSREGAAFEAHHPIYPSSTEVNSVAIATGMYPAGSGLLANVEFRPAIDPAKPFATEGLAAVRKGDALSGGKYLAVQTLPEILHANGKPTAVAGTKDVALLLDRSANRPSGTAGPSPILFEGKTIPETALGEIIKAQGPFPTEVSVPDSERNSWTVNAMTGVFWKESVPALSILWLSDPDYSQHSTGPGSKISLAAIKSCDDYLGRVLDALEKKGVRDQTDVLVVSDHGFSTMQEHFSLEDRLNQAGFKAHHEITAASPADEIMVDVLGGTDLLYVPRHDPVLTRKVVGFLQKLEFTGVIFSREKIDGAFPLETGRINTPDAPDVMVSFRWEDRPSANGTRGILFADGRYKPGQGTHSTLSPFDMHNILFAAGPDFRAGYVDYLPTGNVDLAPTIAWILGVTPPRPMNGRILKEALADSGAASAAPEVEKEIIRAERILDGGKWEQTLNVSRIGNTVYFDEGKGTYTPR